jgi:hypothetical protein
MNTDKPINANTAPKDQVAEMRRLLKDTTEKVDRTIDDQVARSTPMTPRN